MADRHAHWRTELTDDPGHSDDPCQASQIIIANIPDESAVNRCIGSNGWSIYPAPRGAVAVTFSDIGPVIFTTMTFALSEIVKLIVYETTEEGAEFARAHVAACGEFPPLHTRKAA